MDKKMPITLFVTGIALIAVGIYYAQGYPRGSATGGEVILFHFGILLLLVALGLRAIPMDPADTRVALVLGASTLIVWGLAVGVGRIQFIAATHSIVLDRVILVLLFLPLISGIWTGIRATRFPGLNGKDFAFIVAASIVTFTGSVGLGGNFPFKTIIFGLYSGGALASGVALHLLLAFVSREPSQTK